MSLLKISPADSTQQIQSARALFEEYAAELNISFCFQGFSEELDGLPGKYAPPSGRLLLAGSDGQLAGCVAVRKIEDGICEMKRLYVRPPFRGLKIGRRLAEAIIAEARQIGYPTMRLDTLRKLQAALTLYDSLGFKTIPPYYDNPIEDVVYLELKLGI